MKQKVIQERCSAREAGKAEKRDKYGTPDGFRTHRNQPLVATTKEILVESGALLILVETITTMFSVQVEDALSFE